MRLAIIGYGQAGGKILDRFLAYDEATGGSTVAFPLAINTATADLDGLDRVPYDRRLLIGQSRVKGHGVGTDNDLGCEIAREDVDELQAAIGDVPTHEIDAFLIVAGLGGGTGSGGAPVLAERLQRLYTEPVYGLGILPGRDEGGIYSLNAARSVRTFVDVVDNLMLFDNDAWRTGSESIESGYSQINQELVRRFGVLFSAGEVDRRSKAVGENLVDASEVVNTLATGGLSTVGYATSPVESTNSNGLLDRFRANSDEKMAGEDTNRITSLIRSATLGRLTVPCEITDTERALVVVAGPPDNLDRKGIERGRRWLEDTTGCMVVRGGDYPIPNSGHVAAVVLLSGITDVEPVQKLQQTARETVAAREERERSKADDLDELFADDGTLDPLF